MFVEKRHVLSAPGLGPFRPGSQYPAILIFDDRIVDLYFVVYDEDHGDERVEGYCWGSR